MFRRIISGSNTRKTRFHDELGNRVSISRLIRNGPQAIVSGFLRIAVGYRANRPWISYDTQKIFSHFLTSHSRVLEFGSGMSTVWYTQRAGEVVSIEDNESWFHQVQKIIEDRKVENLQYRLAKNIDEYSILTEDERLGGFDLIMIDGRFRDNCIEQSCALLRPGGIIYLDNSDKGTGSITGDVPRARKLLEDFAYHNDATITYFTDFAPTQLFVQQGLLVQISN